MASAEDLDVVSVSTPADARPTVVEEILDRGPPEALLLEKPVGADRGAARRVHEAVEAAGVTTAVNHIRRFPPAYRNLIEDVRAGDLGRVHHARVLYGRGVVHNGVHALDLLRAMFGEPQSLEVLHGDRGDDPNLDLLLSFDGGTKAWFAGIPQGFFPFQVDLIGSEAHVTLDDQGHRLVRSEVLDTGSEHGFRKLDPDAETKETDLAWATRYALENLVACLESGDRPACTVEDGVRALDLALEALARHENAGDR